jgi:2-oxoglutarate ferredoxin oxidoreductase subunit beta
MPGELTLGAQGNFFARVIDKEPRGMEDVFLQAALHKGTSIIEVFQNCVIFNNAIHEQITGKDVRDDRIIYVEHNKPLIFGKERDKGLILKGQDLEVVKIGENGISESDILVHDANNPNPNVHYMLARMTYPTHPVAVGVIRSVEDNTYEGLLEEQIEHAKANSKIKNVDDLLNSGNVFNIE